MGQSSDVSVRKNTGLFGLLSCHQSSQSSAIDTEDLRGADFVSSHACEHAGCVTPFHFVEWNVDCIFMACVIRSCSQILGEIGNVDRFVGGHHAGVADDVLQFTNVARPCVPRQNHQCARSNAANGFTVL